MTHTATFLAGNVRPASLSPIPALCCGLVDFWVGSVKYGLFFAQTQLSVCDPSSLCDDV